MGYLEGILLMEECRACSGTGCYAVGDVEDGVEEICTECDGIGEVEDGYYDRDQPDTLTYED